MTYRGLDPLQIVLYKEKLVAEQSVINAVGLSAKIVTLNGDFTTAIAQVTIPVRSSAEAEAAAKALDVGHDTHSGVLEYYVILTGSGVFGDALTYKAAYFKYAIEPKLVLAPETSAENADEGADTDA